MTRQDLNTSFAQNRPARALTEAQEGLWYFQALDPNNPILNTGQYLDLRGPLDREALETAVARTLAESDTLRLRFGSGPNGPEQWLDPDPVKMSVVDLSDHPTAEAEARSQMNTDSAKAQNLATQPAAAFTLFILGPERHLLYERIHHLVIDGYGMVLVTNRFAEHYASLISDAPLPRSMQPLVSAFQEDETYRTSERRKQDATWWKDTLTNLPEVSGPTPGRAVSGTYFLRQSDWLSKETCVLLTAFSTAHKLSWPDVLTALVGAYLARWSNGEAVIGMPFMARMGRPIARVPCMAMNVLPLVICPDEEMPLGDWITELSYHMRQARQHGLYRSEQLRRDLGLIGGARRLYGPLVNVQPFDSAPVFAGLHTDMHILGAGAVDDLSLTFRGDPDSGILFEVDANPGLYTQTEIAGHAKRIEDFLSVALAEENLSLVPTASRAEIAHQTAQNDATAHPTPNISLTALLEAQMARTPQAPALVFGETTLSYAEVDRRSSALAAQLIEMGAGPNRIVAVALDRSLELSIALLAVLRAGAAYLPLDPDHPAQRISDILDASKPITVLTSADRTTCLPKHAPRLTCDDWVDVGALPHRLQSPDNMAYVIYTSGSTGAPKGVVIEHRAIVNRLLWMQSQYDVGPHDRILQKTPATFDVSVWEFFLPLISGAVLVMAAPGAHRDPSALTRAIRHHAITLVHFVPSMLSAFLASPASEQVSLSKVFCSGEELSADLRDRFHRRIQAELHNLYGPTEAAVDVSFWPAGPEDHTHPVPIGYPVWNTRLEILDDRMRPVPAGLAGHLYLGGVQLARGYLGQEPLTVERFRSDPRRTGERLYATGDLARRRDDGAVVYLGRSDTQVKIRGLRIELGEIEAAILATGLVCETAVVAREDHAGNKRLIAYLVPKSSYDEGQLALSLAAKLPAYMLPSAEVLLEALPLTSNGKLDRKALPKPQFSVDAPRGRTAESDSERLLAALYAEVLHLGVAPTTEADFFALGGDSLSAVTLVLRIEEAIGYDPGVGAVFEHPQLGDLAQVIDAQALKDEGTGPVIVLKQTQAPKAPLFLIHPAGGLSWGYRNIVRQLSEDRPVYGLQHPGLDPDAPMPDSLAALAQNYADRARAISPKGMIHLAGWSVGGILSQAMAVALHNVGHEVGLVAMLDSYPADAWRSEPDPDPAAALRALLAIAGIDPEAHLDLDTRDAVVAFLRSQNTAFGALSERLLDGVIRTVTSTNAYVRAHQHHRFEGTVTHIRAGLDHKDRDLSADMWTPYAAQIDTETVPLLHAEMMSPQAATLIASLLSKRMI